MRFTCTQLALSKAINTVSRAVSSRTTIPVLKGILLSVNDGRLTLSASDLDLSIETSIDVQASEEGKAVVMAKLFGEIIRKLPNSIISIALEEGKLNIQCLGSSCSIVTLPADEFPVIGNTGNKEFIEIGKEELGSLIRKTVFAASIDEKKGVLTGALMNFENSNLEMVALDGFRMAVANKPIKADIMKRVIVPARILFEINKIISEDEGSGEVSLSIEDKKIEILTEDTRVIARLLEGEFIKYREIIPASWKTKVIAGREDLLNSIERASLLAKEGKNNLVKFDIKEGSIVISSRSEEGMVNETVSADVEGDDLIIGFNSKYILDVLKSVGDDEIKMELGTSVSSCLIKPVEGNEYTYLVLPVRMNG